MMVGVPVLLVVCVSAFVPFVCVMVVGVGCSGCRVFQWWVAVASLSRRVPGVGVRVLVWLVLGVCSGVGWLVFGVSGVCVGWCACFGVVGASVGVSWLVCVFWWFRMLTCSGLFLFLVFAFLSCLVNNGLSWVLVCGGGCWGWVFLGWLVFVLCACSLVVGFVCGVGRVFAFGGWLGCCLLVCVVVGVWWVWLFGVWGVLFEVVGCLCGWVGVVAGGGVWVLGLMLVGGCLRLVV